MTATTAELAPVVQRFAHALLTLDEPALTENSTPDVSWIIPGNGLVSGVHVGAPVVIGVAKTIRRHSDAYDSYLDDSPGADRDGAEDVAMSPTSTALCAPLLHRPRFDEASALQVTRAEHFEGQQTGNRT
jgi:hypothetical protein